MLIGDVVYYAGQQRRAGGDSNVSAGYAEKASLGNADTVEWSCRNGDQNDVRYFRDGKQVPAPTWLTRAAQ